MQSEANTWLTTDDFGVVDKLGSDPGESESIVTSFYKAWLPIWPESSAYIIRDPDGSERRIAIPLQRHSVILGYLRAPLWVLAFLIIAPALMVPERFLLLLAPGVMIATFAALSTFVAGKLPEEEMLRRSLLRRVVGFGAPPELLTDDLRAEVCTNLLVMWRARSKRKWVDAIERGEASEILIALAEYHLDGPLLMQARANNANKLWN
ncbi:MAG TPA: hypothetical protein VGM90_12665 [Kofleriaceae bacterium]